MFDVGRSMFDVQSFHRSGQAEFLTSVQVSDQPPVAETASLIEVETSSEPKKKYKDETESLCGL
jgi:hypothetical protein